MAFFISIQEELGNDDQVGLRTLNARNIALG